MIMCIQVISVQAG